MREPRLLLVDWIDASSDRGPLKLDELKPLVRVLTVGWLIRRDAKSISVGAEWFPEEGTFRDITNVPMPCVRKVTTLKRGGR